MMRGMRMRGGVKPQDVGQTIRRLMSYVARYRLRLLLVVLCIILSAVASVLSSTFIGVLIDDYISPLLLQAEPVFTGLARALGVMVCVYVVGMVSGYFYNRLMVNVAQGVLKNVRDEMFAHMQTLPIRYFDTHSHGEVMSHFTNDMDKMSEAMQYGILRLVTSVVLIVGSVVMMFRFNVVMTLLFLVFTLLSMVVTKLFSGVTLRRASRRQQALSQVTGLVEEAYSGRVVIKAFCREQASAGEIHRATEELAQATEKADFMMNAINPTVRLVNRLGQMGIAVFAGWQLLSGQLTVGVFQAFFQYVNQSAEPLTEASYVCLLYTSPSPRD